MEKQDEIDLLIFDCDGVLIDSEILVCAVVGEELTRLGYPLTCDDVVRRFAGRPERDILAEVAADWGQPIPDTYFTATKMRIEHAFHHELQAISGALDVLSRMRLPRCVASSSAPAKLAQGLRHTGLYPLFAPNILSVHSVARGKPAPDVFVFAAGWMRTPVQRCLVLEDSLPGVRAARAAGMRVFGFTGGSHCVPEHAESLLAAGAERVLTHMEELPEALPNAFVHEAEGVHA